jgi:catecholate siderophore receptor
VTTTLGSHNYRRDLGDFNLHTGEDAALRINAMVTKADNNGSGSSIDKSGLAVAYRFGIGTADEFLASLYYLDNHNGMNYGLPWARAPRDRHRPPTPSSAGWTRSRLLRHGQRLQRGQATDGDPGPHAPVPGQRRTQDPAARRPVRSATSARAPCALPAAALQPGRPGRQPGLFGPNTVFTRGTQLKIQDMDTVHLQSDFSRKFEALGSSTSC